MGKEERSGQGKNLRRSIQDWWNNGKSFVAILPVLSCASCRLLFPFLAMLGLFGRERSGSKQAKDRPRRRKKTASEQPTKRKTNKQEEKKNEHQNYKLILVMLFFIFLCLSFCWLAAALFPLYPAFFPSTLLPPLSFLYLIVGVKE